VKLHRDASGLSNLYYAGILLVIVLIAGVEKAKALITTLPSDADNTFVVVTARHLNPKLVIQPDVVEFVLGTPDQIEKLKMVQDK